MGKEKKEEYAKKKKSGRATCILLTHSNLYDPIRRHEFKGSSM